MKAYFSGNPHQEPEPESVDNEPEQVNLDKVDETSSSLTQIQRENVIEANVMIKKSFTYLPKLTFFKVTFVQCIT